MNRIGLCLIAALSVLPACSTAQQALFDQNVDLASGDVAAVQKAVGETIRPREAELFKNIVAGRGEGGQDLKVCGIVSVRDRQADKTGDFFFSGLLTATGDTPNFKLNFIGADESANMAIRSACITSGLDF